jgi:tRNA threonylcarbamoyladenosine biosynthesis protein TsaB
VSTLVLGIDTASAHGGVALLGAGAEPRVRDLGERGRHAESVVPAVLALLAEAGRRVDELDLVAVNVGPGSFTGIRVGVAAALGLSDAAGIPAAGVRCLDILARACYDATSPPIGAYIVSAADVRRGEVVLVHYRVGPEGPVPQGEERLVRVSDPGPAPPEGSLVAGDGGERLWPESDPVRYVPEGPARAIAAARLGEEALAAGVPEEPVPRYARAADARPRRR